jgi:predicted MFS family arabinose efflux permease
MNRGGMLAPLRHPEFRLLFSGQVVSNLGDWLDYLALIVLIAYVWGHGPAALAALAIVIAAPYVVVSPFAGVLADRWPRRAVLVGSDLARAAVVLGLVFAPNIYVLLSLVFVKTVFSTLFNPAEQATIRSVVPDEDLLAANSLTQLSLQGAKVVGPALGGLIVAASSPRVAFAADAASFLVSAAILTRLPRLEAVRADDDDGEGFWSEFRAGLAYIAGRRALALAIGSIAAAMFLVFTFDTLSPLALRALGVNTSLLGLAIAGIGLGAVVGTIAIGQLGRGLNPFGLMGGAKVVVGGLVAVMGIAAAAELDAPPAIWIPVVVGIGIASAGVLIPYPTILQLETPPAMMGRVSATASSIPTVFQLVAPLLGAAAAEWQGIGFVLTVSGCGLMLLGAIVLALRPPVGVGVPGAEELGVRTRIEAPRLDSAEPLEPALIAEGRRRTTDAYSMGPVLAGLVTVTEQGGERMADALETLRSSGIAVDSIPEEQRQVLADLTDEEVRVLASINERVRNAGSDVGGYAMKDTGGIFW